MKRLATTLLTAACAVLPLALVPAATAQAQTLSRPANDMSLSIGRGQLVNVPGQLADVFVADPTIADVKVNSTRQLYVFGKAGGQTTVYATNASGDVVWSSNVRVGSNIDSVDQMLRLAMPDAKVVVSTMGTNTFLLTGTVGAPEDAAEAQRLVSAFVGEGANVITRLKMATPLQVNLQVKFAEVSRSLVKEIGVNLTSLDGSSGMMVGIGQGRSGFSPTMLGSGGPNQLLGTAPKVTTFGTDPASGGLKEIPGTAVVPAVIGTTLAAQGKLFGIDLLGALDLGEKIGLVSTLSQPNLTALSGETADFLAGGEYPIPISQGLGTTTIEYKKYGVSLAYTPTVLANGRISLRVRPEVSELSSQGAVVLNGYQVPALTIRRAETTIELGSGQSFMIAGLLSNNAQNSLSKAPGLGDVPVLGALFKSNAYRRGETELVIVVTPYLVNPVNANDIKLPTDGFQNVNDLQRHFQGLENDGRSGQEPLEPRSGQEVTKPRVGELELPAAAPQPKKGSDKKPRREASAAPAAVNPGFGLK